MPITIKVNGKKERYFVVPGTPAQQARGKVSRENRQEYDNQKRAKELANRMPDGPRDMVAVAVAKMMDIPEHHAKKMINDKKSKVVLDGKID